MRSDRPDEPTKRFADTFAKRPVVPRITRLPGARAWATTVVIAATVAAVVITVPMLGRIGGGSSNQTTVAVDTPITSGNAAKPNGTGTGTGEKKPEGSPTTTPPIVKPGSTIQRPGVTVTAPPAAVTTGAQLPPGQRPPAVNTGSTTETKTTTKTNQPVVPPRTGTTTTTTQNPPAARTTSGTSGAKPPVAAAPAGSVRVQNYASNRCIDVKDAASGVGVDGTPLQVWSCGDNANQKWLFTNGTVQSLGLCMDLAWASTNEGTPVQLVQCNGGWAQKFTLNAAHDLVNPTADKCVTAEGTGDGARLVLRSCNGSSAQKWRKI